MATACAYCDRADPDRKLYPPREWVDYLQRERGLADPDGVLAVPLCAACHDRLALQRDAFRRRVRAGADARIATDDRLAAHLDSLALDALLDDRGPAPDDVGSVL